MDYIRTESNGQLVFSTSNKYLYIPCCLHGFTNNLTESKMSESGRNVFVFNGSVDIFNAERNCTCGSKMHVNSRVITTLRHVSFGGNLTCIKFPHTQFRCPKCGKTKSQYISFKAPNHRITWELYEYVLKLLTTGSFTNKEIAELTGLGKNTIKDIDLKRLKDQYTVNGRLIKPEKTTKHLGIDEFKLHNGRIYATHIIDMENGHILWIAKGKSKRVVYDFIKHVGLDWMDSVEAVACDMNSDFQEAFEEMCPHIQPVFDHFHIVKNFNDKVISEIRKEEQKRLYAEGNRKAAQALKKTKYILTSNRSTLMEKDKQAQEGHKIRKGSTLFGTTDIVRKGGNEEKYNNLLKENELLFTIDMVKEKLSFAYTLDDEIEMSEQISEIIEICYTTNNRHLKWFGNLLLNHFEGIIAHATYKISSGKIEGINQKIKTLRRQGYGYPDDEYFFLKLVSMSRQRYIRNPKSHRICD